MKCLVCDRSNIQLNFAELRFFAEAEPRRHDGKGGFTVDLKACTLECRLCEACTELLAKRSEHRDQVDA